MAYSAKAVANTVRQKAMDAGIADLTPLKLQRLLWFTQCRALANGSAILDDIFCRWKYGPVIPSLYHALQSFKSSTVTQPMTVVHDGHIYVPQIPVTDLQAQALVMSVLAEYGHKTVEDLVDLTKEWAGSGAPITYAEMVENPHSAATGRTP